MVTMPYGKVMLISTCLWVQGEGSEGTAGPTSQLGAPAPPRSSAYCSWILTIQRNFLELSPGLQSVTAPTHTQPSICADTLCPQDAAPSSGILVWGPRLYDRCLPDAMQVEEINLLPEAAKEAVADPARQCESPQNHRDLNEMPKLLIVGPREGRREMRTDSKSRACRG